MKKILLGLFGVCCAATLFAQAPEKFSYQAVVRNASNQLVSSATVGVRVSILQGGVNGVLVYMETHTAVTNANGLVTLQIGSGNVQQGIFADIDWANGLYFLKTETDPNGGSDYSVISTQQLLSVPYALYSKEAGNGFSGDYNDLTNKPEIPTVPDSVSAFINDAGYLTSFTEQQVLSISNDTIFLTGGSFAKLPEGFSGDYNDLANQPTIPIVPSDVSAFNNDAGYITMDSVPTNVSAFTNDAGYLTGYTETDPEFNAWDKDYNDLINTPDIPTIPNNVSAFNNDAGYITMDSVPTNVSAFNNDAGYLTGYTETDPQFNAWDKDYNDLINKPTIPTMPNNVSVFTNDAGYITFADLNSYIVGLQEQIDSLSRVIESMGAMQLPDNNSAMLPVVTTDVVTVLTGTTATSGGTVTSPDGTPVLSRGLCWSLHQNPTIDDNVVLSGLGQGHFVADLSALTAGALYYVRAFAVNAHGVAYGGPRMFVSGNPNAMMVTVHFASSDTTIGFVNQTDTTVIYGSTISFPGVTGLHGWVVDYWVEDNDTSTHISPSESIIITSEMTYHVYFKDNNIKFKHETESWNSDTWHNAYNDVDDCKEYVLSIPGMTPEALWEGFPDTNGSGLIYIPGVYSYDGYENEYLYTYIKVPEGYNFEVYDWGSNGWKISTDNFEAVPGENNVYVLTRSTNRTAIYGIKIIEE